MGLVGNRHATESGMAVTAMTPPITRPPNAIATDAYHDPPPFSLSGLETVFARFQPETLPVTVPRHPSSGRQGLPSLTHDHDRPSSHRERARGSSSSVAPVFHLERRS
jgi:hypothetical protein